MLGVGVFPHDEIVYNRSKSESLRYRKFESPARIWSNAKDLNLQVRSAYGPVYLRTICHKMRESHCILGISINVLTRNCYSSKILCIAGLNCEYSMRKTSNSVHLKHKSLKNVRY